VSVDCQVYDACAILIGGFDRYCGADVHGQLCGNRVLSIVALSILCLVLSYTTTATVACAVEFRTVVPSTCVAVCLWLVGDAKQQQNQCTG
jgi:hypothetical protein